MQVRTNRAARDTKSGPTAHRLVTGLGWGAVATVLMSVVMFLGTAVGVAPVPRPVPVALTSQTVGTPSQQVLLLLAGFAHLSYGAVAAAVLAGSVRRVSVRAGIGHGVLLWALMGLVWLPYLGWGLFGIAVSPRVAVATLVPHLVYGTTVGLGIDRHRALGADTITGRGHR
ncbi:hypothetical protein [Actinopolyspora mortivallis]|uniref:DUF1440 domain-containing protein n=1 Tax=Actinopolyspora mortivallis TaxID=33906 RepID=A0A2T0GVB7_ACTMO|nr:hypothetical protein [Actinopolyspora mortivallis]PRW63044.1 hypothetical protein CEP50_12130 [Actinopolyspora mortivallis]